jgi:histidine phosphotransferase ChpT
MNEVHNMRKPNVPHISWEGSSAGTELASSVASRMCHDLASPLGAIANGLELLQLAGLEPSPELTLLEESIASAKARVRFFRLAFGAAGSQPVGRSEIIDILSTISRGSRISYDWTVEGDVPRTEVKAAFLLLQCLETALPLGGQVHIGFDGRTWNISAHSLRLRINRSHWDCLDHGAVDAPEAANLVQFILLPQAISDLGRRLCVEVNPDRITGRF